MGNRGSNSHTNLIKAPLRPDSGAFPLMSYTAVTSLPEMAQAFVDLLLEFGRRVMPDRSLSATDLVAICRVALENTDEGATMLEGRELRIRISEQLSRADRYKEPFSVLVIKMSDPTDDTYESIVDALYERMRRTDMMFLFKTRVVLILPHTTQEACLALKNRIASLLISALRPQPTLEYQVLTYPNPTYPSGAHVLDWTEDQLRS